ncbi:hypothetical protein [Sinomonas atrocyanea]|uniref:hypothetical protein n=1 Tax=Sinomonas atrocyanea TaxID=37927 RepID=UPI00285DD001|nr:hypothetical protein [Sinomonas atrocyanea]MDR6623626.1 hypothetical protein [Sinomonas atrocyanea]
MSVKRQPQIPLTRAPREDVVGAVAAGAAREESEAAPGPAPAAAETPPVRPVPERGPQLSRPAKKRLVTFTNRLDPDLLDWMTQYKDDEGVTIAAQLDEAVRDLIEKKTGKRPQP